MKFALRIFVLLNFAAFPVSWSMHAQTMEAKWSGKEFYDNKKEGFFSSFIGGNSRMMYCLYSNRAKRTNKERLRIAAFDQNDMRQLAAVDLTDRRKEEQRAKYAGLNYVKTVVYEKSLLIIWKREERLKAELYIEEYDDKLQLKTPLKKIFETATAEKSSRRAAVVLATGKSPGVYVALAQYPFRRDSGMTVEYALLDSSFKNTSAGSFKISTPGAPASDFLNTSYQLSGEGHLHIQTRVLTERGRDASRDVYTIYTLVDPAKKTAVSFPLQFSGKNVFDVGMRADKGSLKLFGFFCDLEKDPSGEETHGIFYALVDVNAGKIANQNFSYFTREQLAKLFEKSRDDSRRRRITGRRGESEESLGSFYQIENVQTVDSADLVLFCSVMRNVSRVSCDNRGMCVTYYYCQKYNVTAFRIAADGKIVWASNLDRYTVYDGWDVRDVHVIRNDKKFYVTYGSMLQAGKEQRNFFARKSARHTRDYFEYAVFDYETGEFKKEELLLNPPGTSRKEIKTIHPMAVQVVNNRFFVHSIQVRPKPWVCATGVLFPLYFALLSSGDSYMGAGYLGTIKASHR